VTVRALKPPPDWLVSGQPAVRPRGPSVPRGSRRRTAFLEKTLSDGADVARRAMYAESAEPHGDVRGILFRVDPRIKLVSLFLLLVGVALVHSPLTLAAVYLGLVVLAWIGGLPVGSFVKRVWLFVPLFTAVTVAPATLSIITPGEIVVPLWTWHGAPEGITAQGLTTAGLVILRVACSVSLVLLVTISTSWNRLLAALGALGVPPIFVSVVAMAYRYLFVLLGSVLDMFLARKARTVQPIVHNAGDRRFVGAAVGTLLGRAGHLSEEVHQAMTARGYAGRHHPLDGFRATGKDLLALAASLVVAVAIVGSDHLLR
jgi:cobalt ECF transporter T component CbiQ